MKRGVSKFPPSQMRLRAEDVLAEGLSASSSGLGKSPAGDSEIVDNTFALLDDY